MNDHRDVIAAFLDQEPVDVPALERALADPDGREYFLDLLVLRGLIGGSALRPSVAVQGDRSDRHDKRRSALWLAAAAALIAVGTTGGYMAGRVIDRSATTTPATTTAPASAATTGAPAPTHVIRLENGVTWNEKSGGN